MSRTNVEVVHFATFLGEEEGHHGAHAPHSHHTDLLNNISNNCVSQKTFNLPLLFVFLT